jgi:hypothetical protein
VENEYAELCLRNRPSKRAYIYELFSANKMTLPVEDREQLYEYGQGKYIEVIIYV